MTRSDSSRSRRRPLAILSAAAMTTAALGDERYAGAAPPDLVISEIMYNPASAENDWEWVEVTTPARLRSTRWLRDRRLQQRPRGRAEHRVRLDPSRRHRRPLQRRRPLGSRLRKRLGGPGSTSSRSPTGTRCRSTTEATRSRCGSMPAATAATTSTTPMRSSPSPTTIPAHGLRTTAAVRSPSLLSAARRRATSTGLSTGALTTPAVVRRIRALLPAAERRGTNRLAGRHVPSHRCPPRSPFPNPGRGAHVAIRRRTR